MNIIEFKAKNWKTINKFIVLTSKTNVYTHLLIMGNTPIPVMKNERRKKLKDETREYIVPIRMTFTEKDKIKKRAEKTNKSISTFMRDSALRLWNKRKAR